MAVSSVINGPMFGSRLIPSRHVIAIEHTATHFRHGDIAMFQNICQTECRELSSKLQACNSQVWLESDVLLL